MVLTVPTYNDTKVNDKLGKGTNKKPQCSDEALMKLLESLLSKGIAALGHDREALLGSPDYV